MQFIKNVFWNANQRRVRSLWRLMAQIILIILIALPIQLGLGFVILTINGPTGEVTANLMTLMQLPLVVALASLGILLAILVGVWLAGRLLDRRSFADFGFHLSADWWTDLGFGLFLGAFLMLIIFLVELAAGWVTVSGTFVTGNPETPFGLAILAPAFLFVAVGIYEELFSRGYQLRNMAEGLNWRAIGPRWALVIATLLSSALFGLAHANNPNASLISTVNIFVAGAVLLAIGYLLTGELAIPIGVHITWNFFQGNVFGFPVSGGEFSSATFISIQQSGPDLWTGGVFGPEAGLLGLGAILLGGGLTAMWVRWRYGRVWLQTALAEYSARRAGN
jgi:membrane protease YdiL (CAAX protease family)